MQDEFSLFSFNKEQNLWPQYSNRNCCCSQYKIPTCKNMQHKQGKLMLSRGDLYIIDGVSVCPSQNSQDRPKLLTIQPITFQIFSGHSLLNCLCGLTDSTNGWSNRVWSFCFHFYCRPIRRCLSSRSLSSVIYLKVVGAQNH